MLLIYQMAKVASRAWVFAASPAAAKEHQAPVHAHYLSQGHLAALAAINAMSGPPQTISNRLILRELIRKGPAVRVAIEEALRGGERIRIISGIRDPVARSLSLVHFFADFCGDVSRPLDRFRGGEGAATAAATRKWWSDALAGVAPEDSFARFMTFQIGCYRSWFHEELEALFGVSLGGGPFPEGQGAERLSGGAADVLLYRLEDMAPDAPAYGGLLNCASEFLGIEVTGWLAVNTAATRRSFPRYEAARAALRLDTEVLDAIYGVPIVSRFYSHSEIEGFKRKWMA
jgi:hypothetical protein